MFFVVVVVVVVVGDIVYMAVIDAALHCAGLWPTSLSKSVVHVGVAVVVAGAVVAIIIVVVVVIIAGLCV